MRGTLPQSFRPTRKENQNSYFTEDCLRIHLLNFDAVPLIRLLRRHLTTVAAKRFPGTIRARQSCRICSPSGRTGSRSLIAPASRGPSSKSVRFFCHRQRFTDFLERGSLHPPLAALRLFPPRGRLWSGVIAEALTTTRGARRSAETGELSPPCFCQPHKVTTQTEQDSP